MNFVEHGQICDALSVTVCLSVVYSLTRMRQSLSMRGNSTEIPQAAAPVAELNPGVDWAGEFAARAPGPDASRE